MRSKRRSFQRPLGFRRYRKLFVIAVEGTRTEPEYFSAFNRRGSVIRLACLKDRHKSAPLHVLQRMKKYLREESLKDSDEAWLVVDKDNWTDSELQQLHQWSSGAKNYGFELSNPNFELWLLLHFENADGVSNAHDCLDRLLRYIPDYDKCFDSRRITEAMITDAISRAKGRDTPPCRDWPRSVGTTVYRLVQSILYDQRPTG